MCLWIMSRSVWNSMEDKRVPKQWGQWLEGSVTERNGDSLRNREKTNITIDKVLAQEATRTGQRATEAI